MKYKVSKVLGINSPLDGYTPEEKVLERILTTTTIQMLYGKLPTARLKFIMAAHYELGYSQQLLAEMLNVSQPSLNEELALIKMILLGYKYRPRKFKDTMKPEQLLQLLMNLS